MRGWILMSAFALLLSMLFCGQAQAAFQVPPGSLAALGCASDRIYGYGDSGAPDAVAALFKSNDTSLAYRVCTDFDGNTHTFVRAPKTMSPDICRIEEREIFPGKSGDIAFADHIANGSIYSDRLAGWSNLPPEAWLARHYLPGYIGNLAFIAKGACPSAASGDYVGADHISDGMIRAFGRFWQDATASSQKFEQVFAHVEMRKYLRPPGMVERNITPASEWIRMMEPFLFGPNGNHLRVWDLSCDTDCHANVGTHGIVYFDMGPKGLEIIAVAYQMLI